MFFYFLDDMQIIRDTYNYNNNNNTIIMCINCNWVVIRWQWLFYMYADYETGY